MGSPIPRDAFATLVVLVAVTTTVAAIPTAGVASGAATGDPPSAATPPDVAWGDETTGLEPLTLDFETLPGGGETTDGMVLTDDYGAYGVGFEPQGSADDGAVVVDCTRNRQCLGARSGDRVVRGVARGEFSNYPLVITFDEPRPAVALSVRSVRSSSPITVEAELRAEDASGDVVDVDRIEFSNAEGWERLHVAARDGEARVSRVILTGGNEDVAGDTNFLYVDDLTVYGGEETTPVPEDTTAPTVSITDPPSGATRSGSHFELYTWARDDTRLSVVRYFVTGSDGTDRTPSENRICGSPGFPCPAGDETFSEHVTIRTPEDGRYTVAVEACDPAGNCGRRTRAVAVDAPDEPAPLRVPSRVEVTQGVQTRLWEVDGPGTAKEALGTQVPLIANRTTVLRFYLTAEGGNRPDFSADLAVTVFRRDGTTRSLALSPNANPGTVTVPADPGTFEARDDLHWQQRADVNRTLNFVVPAEVLEDAETLDVSLQGETGHLQIPVQRQVVLGIVPIYLDGTAIDPPGVPQMHGVYQQLRASYPVSDVRVVQGDGWRSVSGAPGETPFSGRFLWVGNEDKCGKVLSKVHNTYTGDALPERNVPDYAVVLGIAGGGLDGCSGMAYMSRPTAIAHDDPNVVPQEIGHTMHITHASNDHDEKSGGGYEEWPYTHGTISPEASAGIDHAVFGVIPQRRAGDDWRLLVVDPCPTSDLSKRAPTCTLSDGRKMHDFMSYGPWNTWTPGVFPGGDAFRWASDVTYRRLYARMLRKDGALSLAPASETTPMASGAAPVWTIRTAENRPVDRVEATIVSGIEHENGTVELLSPVQRKPLARSSLTGDEGPYTLTLEDGDGTELVSRSFGVDRIRHQDKDGMFWVAVPYHEDATRLTIARAGEEVLTREASPHAPTVRILHPNGGETFAEGEHTIEWEASDPDGDPLSYLVQYSPDGGESWQGITSVGPGQGTTATVHVEGHVPGKRGIIRVTASDGFNTAVDRTDGYVSLGTDEPPESGGPGPRETTSGAGGETETTASAGGGDDGGTDATDASGSDGASGTTTSIGPGSDDEPSGGPLAGLPPVWIVLALAAVSVVAAYSLTRRGT